MAFRSPTPSEVRLLQFLIDQSGTSFEAQNWLQDLLVTEMCDGEMGSLLLFPGGRDIKGRKFGRQISECQFTDEDGIEVVASLNLDQFGHVYELDIWKTNFEKLIRIPDVAAEFRCTETKRSP